MQKQETKKKIKSYLFIDGKKFPHTKLGYRSIHYIHDTDY